MPISENDPAGVISHETKYDASKMIQQRIVMSVGGVNTSAEICEINSIYYLEPFEHYEFQLGTTIIGAEYLN